MTTLQLGYSAYRRNYGKAPEIRLENRFLEKAPQNLRENTTLLTRPGTKHLADFPNSDPDGHIRANYAMTGLFNGDLFTVSGDRLWRFDGTTRTAILGTIGGDGYDAPRYAWAKGEGYEHLFLADGTRLYFYPGGTHAKGVLTYDGSGSYDTDVLIIGGTYYTWSATLTDPDDDGTSAHPFKAKNSGDLFENMVKLLKFEGTPGVDFSLTLGGPSPIVRGKKISSTELEITALSEEDDGDLITTSLGSGASGNLSWGDTHLDNGGNHVLHQIATPEMVGITALASLNGFVLCSVANSQRFYWIRPGEVSIDPLDFAAKESGPDPIVDMMTVGDIVVVAGTGSTEYWASTGDNALPVAPIQGRTTSAGIVPGTLTVINEGTYCCVGSDWRVYAVGDGPVPISDNGIEERIRRQLRREAGLAP